MPAVPARVSKIHLVGVVIAHLVAIAGCYDPDLRDCTVSCATPSDCANGQSCVAGWCTGTTTCSIGPVGDDQGDDEPGATDAAIANPPDAPPNQAMCQLGCTNGTCLAGVCVIDCSALNACAGDVMCPPNIPCRVVCG